VPIQGRAPEDLGESPEGDVTLQVAVFDPVESPAGLAGVVGSFVEYKAKLAGVPVVAVDPRNSSRTCSACGHCATENRRTRDLFECQHCHYSTDADFNAARNLRAWAACKTASKLVGLTA
jgi:ribosomal protein L37AE/L43A